MSSASPSPLVIGTRGSPLALAQANEVRTCLLAAFPALDIDISVIRTTGDSITDRTLAAIGGKGLFTKEIEQALLDGTIDIAVHSMKDVPTVLPEGLIIDCFLPREDPRDGFFSSSGSSLESLPSGAVIGTASLRRQAQILHARPDLSVVPLRGNVDTRLRKLADGVVDATLLAVAGLKRLGHAEKITQIVPPETMLPAVAQGAIGIERRERDERVATYLAALNDTATATRVSAERTLLATLDGSCKTPIAALAEFTSDRSLWLRALIVRPDGTRQFETERSGDPADAARMGREAGEELRRRAGADFFDLPIPESPTR
ncbi:MAG TPA: hydroxymethylbilane synthase [Aliidongia sp.]|nr:hydroxymethylbilane synthase [Aliidongia sp.]